MTTLCQRPLLLPDEVAAILRVSPRTVRRWAGDGTLKCVRVAGSLRFRPDDIAALIEQAKQSPGLTGTDEAAS
jgi:excisionase family DNA binding protein